MATAHAQLRDLERRYKWINFREPVMVSGPNHVNPYFGCRACIALRGLQGHDVTKLPATREEWDRHMKEEHGL